MNNSESRATSAELPVTTKDKGQVEDGAGKTKAKNKTEVKQQPTVSATAHLDSVFAVYKPKGWSSADVVSKIKVNAKISAF